MDIDVRKTPWFLCWQVMPRKLEFVEAYESEKDALRECEEANSDVGIGLYIVKHYRSLGL